MIDFYLRLILICNCGCRGIYQGENKNENYFTLMERVYADGWNVSDDDEENICPYCLKERNEQ
jgi:hypothetical protein